MVHANTKPPAARTAEVVAVVRAGLLGNEVEVGEVVGQLARPKLALLPKALAHLGHLLDYDLVELGR